MATQDRGVYTVSPAAIRGFNSHGMVVIKGEVTAMDVEKVMETLKRSISQLGSADPAFSIKFIVDGQEDVRAYRHERDTARSEVYSNRCSIGCTEHH